MKKLSFVAHQKLEGIMLSSFQSSGLSPDHSTSRTISKKQKISFIPLLGSDPLSYEKNSDVIIVKTLYLLPDHIYLEVNND